MFLGQLHPSISSWLMQTSGWSCNNDGNSTVGRVGKGACPPFRGAMALPPVGGGVLAGRGAPGGAALSQRAPLPLRLLIFAGSVVGAGKEAQGPLSMLGVAGAFGLSSRGLSRAPEAGLESDGSKLDVWRLKEEGGLLSGVLEEAGPNSILWSSRGVNGLWVLTALKAFRASLMISALVFCLDADGR